MGRATRGVLAALVQAGRYNESVIVGISRAFDLGEKRR
jgi:hypothetical protein